MSAPLRLLLVGPLPPPSGGMANQTRQLKRLLEGEGITVTVLQTNLPYRPHWVGAIRGVRALVRLVPYLWRLFVEAGRADVVHVMANSGWAWHLLAAPAIRIASARGTPVVVNYRGGLAAEFLASQQDSVRRTLRRAAALVVPSGFLLDVFSRHQIHATVVPNIVDREIFHPDERAEPRAGSVPHIVVARNLEHLYGNDIAIRALAALRVRFPTARLSIAGSGPELRSLQQLAVDLRVADSVEFTGRLEVDQMAALYRSADVVLNPSRADNTPNSILEALACGIPVVTTNVGGTPFLVEHARSAWLVELDSPEEAADGLARVLVDPELRQALRKNGFAVADACAWAVVKEQWLSLYRRVADDRSVASTVASGIH